MVCRLFGSFKSFISNESYQSMTIEVLRDIDPALFRDKSVVAALGNFDGVHLGHQALFERLLALQKRHAESSELSVKSMVVSFFPPPTVVLNKEARLAQLMTVRQKVMLLDDLGVDYLCLLRFNRNLAEISAERFVTDVLIGQLNIAALVLGEDAGVGNRREGDAEFIASAFKRGGRVVDIAPLLEVNGEKVSSRRIRSCLEMGDIRQVNQFLGRPFTLTGRVARDARRGASLGFPTANIYPFGQLLPRYGVYATLTRLNDEVLPSVTNVGMRPTFTAVRPAVETHLLDFDTSEFYGQRIDVEFYRHLRDERKFLNKQGLVAQIEQDILKAREVLSSSKLP